MTFARLRIWAAMLLILGLFGAPPGSTAEAYQESPWLRDDVSAGRLPPVGERLPADPLVVDLKAQGKEIGKPGGTAHDDRPGQRRAQPAALRLFAPHRL
jgi:hypothetical protein